MVIDRVDFRLPEARMYRPAAYPARHPFWSDYFMKVTHELFQKGGLIMDIGGGLRVDAARGDKENPAHVAAFGKYLADPTVQYNVTDYTDQYHPDFVEDIHHLSFADDSIDGLICLAVLEHVYDPKLAAEEIVRVMKKGGQAVIYVPFMYRYHANLTEDYKDYFRYSKDGISYLFRDCASVEICPVRGLFESLLRFTPLHTLPFLATFLRWIDWNTQRMRTISERQSSGYFIRLVK